MRNRGGPPPQPTALRILRGDPSKGKGLSRNEPRPGRGSLAAPEWLDTDARAIWDDLAPELGRLGLLTKLDRSSLASGCAWWSIYRRALAILDDGLTVDTPNNGRIARPEVAIAHKAYAAAMGTLGRFGVTPSDRVRLSTGLGEEKAVSKWGDAL